MSSKFRSYGTKTSAFILSLTVAGVAFAQGVSVTIDDQEIILRDVPPGAWYTTFIRDAVRSGIVSGYRDAEGEPIGLFGPADPVTVAQTLKIAVEGAGYDVSTVSGTGDTIDHWAAPYLRIAAAEQFDVFESPLNIDLPATRAQVAGIFADAFKIDAVSSIRERYRDVGDITPYAFDIEALSRDGVLNGDTDLLGKPIGIFRPLSFINRAETTKIVMVARSAYGMPASSSSSRSSLSSSSSSSRSSLSSSSSSSSSSSLSSSSSSRSSSSMSSLSSSSSVSSVPTAFLIMYSGTGFSPSVLSVNSGTTIRFRNDSTGNMWVATDEHPSHTNYPGFDAMRSYVPGESYYFTFDRAGTWGYHNHVSPTQTGTIIVR